MTREQAITKARKMLGKNAEIRVSASLTSPDRREAARARANAAREQIDALKREIAEREQAAGIPELRERKAKLAQERDYAMAESCHYKFTVGHVVSGLFLHVDGQGDTWEEAFAKAEREKATA
jgi:hypothetical protein